jgi:hypothetical protein
MVLKATFNNISVILLVDETGVPEEITDLSQVTEWKQTTVMVFNILYTSMPNYTF